ncbi:helix-turn-helix domain-containing protein [Dermatobacter hominis]|uniref:helix-turn-helix domain-containing protein n=1 Tax=Dermatobacter hominis TaxID=2884263 RepID=UPI001D1243FB|nr:helix-turn-helix domain-containing protein [Dermatobacter hominis]UDY37037.1 helix-turn-helix domain-containing protein [Dermatobacter hominis]
MATAVRSGQGTVEHIPDMEFVMPAGIELVDWPAQADLRVALARASVPRLLTVPAGELPPTDLAPDEDWIRVPCAEDDIRVRAEQVLRVVRERSEETSWIDDQRVLHRGVRTAVLTASEATVAEVLLAEPGRVVSRTELIRRLWPAGAPSERAIDAVVYRLRRSCQDLGLVIRAARGRGFVLDTCA